jgi:predicted GIY-YIG superfamily endonuclease
VKERKPNGYWTYDKCKEVASLCKSRKELNKKYKVVYNKIVSKRWINELCSHLDYINKPKGYWTLERCKEIASNYKNRFELQKEYNKVYNIIRINGLLDEYCKHMFFIHKPKGYWTLERCKEAALKCKSRKEFGTKYKTAYTVSRKNKWLDDICSHMILLGNIYKRFIYAWEFEDKSMYIGLTCNIEKRKKYHLNNKKSPVLKHIIKTNLIPKNIILTELLDVKNAQIEEEYYINLYKNNNWNLLNKAKAGALGGYMKWNKESCKKAALKCKSKTDFIRKYSGSYGSSLKNNWLDEICSHMLPTQKPKYYWTKEKCQEVALKCKSRKEFNRKFGTAYKKSCDFQWLNEICSHMIQYKNQIDIGQKKNIKKQH